MTEAGLQPIPPTPETARTLTRRRERCGRGSRLPPRQGRRVRSRNWTRRHFKPAAERAGVPWASPHKLRYGAATLMAERGYQAHDIAKMLRHAGGGALAQKTYMHPKVRAVDFIDDVSAVRITPACLRLNFVDVQHRANGAVEPNLMQASTARRIS
jgi:integrase